MALVFAIVLLYFFFKLLFLSIPFLHFFIIFNSVSIHYTNGRWYQHVLTLCTILTAVILKSEILPRIVFDNDRN